MKECWISIWLIEFNVSQNCSWSKKFQTSGYYSQEQSKQVKVQTAQT